ncbi:interleukin 17a/f1 [Pangasianodon hypophthalmus]|uniref:interleukin 17a/f1 n=1 Tax=Pangasianodon hypophthalmus TaxID=310915 RepID=UPI000F0100EA|nr:interleukin 17a/f1 [Pangasianodon hypophthalmus]
MALKITLLTLPCVAMMMMMMMMVAQAAPQKLQGKAGAHHKPANSHGEDSPKYYIISNLEQEIKPASMSIRPIHNDSISPWEYISTTDSNRIPSQLHEARCLLTGCLNWNGVETLELESRRIFRQIPVLQRVRGDDKNYFFRLEYKTISVGCTCVRPYVEQI